MAGVDLDTPRRVAYRRRGDILGRAPHRAAWELPAPVTGPVRIARRGSTLARPLFLGFGAFMFVFSLTVQEGLHQSAPHSGLAITPSEVTFLSDP
jgi:hypothetical protein